MKKGYILFVISVIAAVSMQFMFLYNSYQAFADSELRVLDDMMYRAIDLELHSRLVANKQDVKNEISITTYNDLP